MVPGRRFFNPNRFEPVQGCCQWLGLRRQQRGGEKRKKERKLPLKSVLWCKTCFMQARITCGNTSLFLQQGFMFAQCHIPLRAGFMWTSDKDNTSLSVFLTDLWLSAHIQTSHSPQTCSQNTLKLKAPHSWRNAFLNAHIQSFIYFKLKLSYLENSQLFSLLGQRSKQPHSITGYHIESLCCEWLTHYHTKL